MNEKKRHVILKIEEEYSNNIAENRQILDEINNLVEKIKDDEKILQLKQLGNEYKENLKRKEEIVKQKEMTMSRIRTSCTHPILCRLNYKKHRDKSSRVIDTEREDAEYSTVRCLECGKITYTKRNDGTNDWDSYIYTPNSLLGSYNDQYIRTYIVDLPANMTFKKLYDYYQEIMLQNSQVVTIEKIKQKVKN